MSESRKQSATPKAANGDGKPVNLVERARSELLATWPAGQTLAMIDRTVMLENLLAAHSADSECAHGHVPGTTPPQCACFTYARAAA